jgi:hypothetical protein
MRLRVGLLVAALVALALVADLWPVAPPSRDDDRGALTAAEADQPRQTSDGLAGEIAAALPPSTRAAAPRIDNRRSWRMAPGVRFRRWDQTDARGQVRAYLVSVDWDAPGVALDYGSGGRHVPDRDTVSGILGREGAEAVVGTNGGFFDIYDTGAPLGVGEDRQRGFLHGARHTWRNAFWTTADGTPRIGQPPLNVGIAEYPQMVITNANSPRAREGGIGLWDPKWGETSGYSITDGQQRGVRMVVVQDGRVVANTTDLSRGRDIRGQVLVGRGAGAEQLAQLRVGARATIRAGLAGDPAFALGGESVLLSGGRVRVGDDRVLHPRTAIGIDRDGGRVLLLVVDGRQQHSRGLTLVELGRMMKRLGAESALNLDGGGSSEIVGRDREGRRRLLNQPSDGQQRAVPDGVVVRYAAP